MKPSAPTLIKFLQNYPKKFEGILQGLKAAERFVCKNPETLPEVDSKPLAKQTMTSEPLPLPFSNMIFELLFEEKYPVILHLVSPDSNPGFVSISAHVPLLSDNGQQKGYAIQEVVLKGTVNQKWKVVRLLNDLIVVGSPGVPQSEYQEFLNDHASKVESLVKTSVVNFVSFLKVLTASNTSRYVNEISRLKKSRSNGADKDYYTVRLNKPKSSAKCISTGSHRSPIPHSRRSHIRRYSNGKSIIIPSSYINANMGSGANRHYEF